MSGFKLKISKDIKKRIDKLYYVLGEAQFEEKDTTEIEKRILKLEKRYIEYTLRIKLTLRELRELKSIVNVKIVFPGSKVVGVSNKPRFFTCQSKKQYQQSLNSSNDKAIATFKGKI